MRNNVLREFNLRKWSTIALRMYLNDIIEQRSDMYTHITLAKLSKIFCIDQLQHKLAENIFNTRDIHVYRLKSTSNE